MRTPLIGITAGPDPDGESARNAFYAAYLNAVVNAGGRAVLIEASPLSCEKAAVIVDGFDGILLSGGRDVHPSRYMTDEEMESRHGGVERLLKDFEISVDEQRDANEIPLAEAALASGKPILGICRGLQLLNVAMGGRLVMDIRTQIRHVRYKEAVPGHAADESASHVIEIEQDSHLCSILNGATSLVVNSRHHQGFTENEKARDLRAVAAAGDGMVEAVESTQHPWVTAVHWHPERREDDYIYQPSLAIFKSFVEAAASMR